MIKTKFIVCSLLVVIVILSSINYLSVNALDTYYGTGCNSVLLEKRGNIRLWGVNYVNPSGLVLDLSMDGIYNGKVLDLSGYGNDGTISGSSHIVTGGKVGNCISFNGIDDKINCGTNINATTGLTLSAWFKYINDVGQQNNDSILTKMTGGLVWKIGVESNNHIRFDYKVNNSNENMNGATLTQGIWYHLTGTFNSSIPKIYINGTLVNSSSFGGTYPIDDTLAYTNVGYESANGRYYKGLIDEVRIYTRELTAIEVMNLYNGSSYEIWDSATLKYQGLTYPNIHDFITETTPTTTDPTGSMSVDYMVIFVIDLFSIILGVIGIMSIPVISFLGILISLGITIVQIFNGNITNELLLSVSITSVLITAVCFAIAWGKK